MVTNRYGRPVRRASSTGGAAEGENGNKGRTSFGRKRKASEVRAELCRESKGTASRL